MARGAIDVANKLKSSVYNAKLLLLLIKTNFLTKRHLDQLAVLPFDCEAICKTIL